ncbi:putative signal transduction protein [Desulfobulbus propionicus DSM 2032]|jgi:HD-like signal output (HDOD) protein|uniref:Signal transduction protein n=1 Tax=Desulfobulbus propionicus (strain ATCC 33891 / DSM 2032 / VKM B-1956 / 1pr3) TaxID=577650 RepID=A0A7U4DQ88_DESPD|nr:HDOD domain-containing protein [Desulfobulbus propionicus]ADW18941.1 putative signal transduction protein [Desulfobulbus propionicus DSM 2032]
MPPAASLIENFKKIRTLPHIVTRLVQLVNDEESTLQDFEAVIRLDPALVARLLTLVNSSYFGLARKVDSISRAVALLGMKNLHNIAVTDAIQGMLRSSSGTVEFSPQRLWLHSAASGICCKMIAERIFTINGDDAYLCGVLHDIGLIVEMEVEQEIFLQLIEQLTAGGPAIIELEQQLLGTDHCQIGYLLAQEWRIPGPIAEAIRDHHHDNGHIIPHSPTGILQMSEYIIQQLNFPAVKEGLPASLAPALATHIQSNVEEYRVLAEDLPEELEKTEKMYGG